MRKTTTVVMVLILCIVSMSLQFGISAYAYSYYHDFTGALKYNLPIQTPITVYSERGNISVSLGYYPRTSAVMHCELSTTAGTVIASYDITAGTLNSWNGARWEWRVQNAGDYKIRFYFDSWQSEYWDISGRFYDSSTISRD